MNHVKKATILVFKGSASGRQNLRNTSIEAIGISSEKSRRLKLLLVFLPRPGYRPWDLLRSPNDQNLFGLVTLKVSYVQQRISVIRVLFCQCSGTTRLEFISPRQINCPKLKGAPRLYFHYDVSNGICKTQATLLGLGNSKATCISGTSLLEMFSPNFWTNCPFEKTLKKSWLTNYNFPLNAVK